jgi:hypothetical protein
MKIFNSLSSLDQIRGSPLGPMLREIVIRMLSTPDLGSCSFSTGVEPALSDDERSSSRVRRSSNQGRGHAVSSTNGINNFAQRIRALERPDRAILDTLPPRSHSLE